MRCHALILFIVVLAITSPLVAQVELTAVKGATPGEVELEWTGGQSPFRIYRGGYAPGVTSPANKIVETPERAWSDAPPPGEFYFYRVTQRVNLQSTALSYGALSTQSIDLYTAQQTPVTPTPLVILAHGGLWQSGDKSALSTLCSNIVEESGGALACASINYRLSQDLGGICSAPGADTYFDQVMDMASAYAHLQNEASTYGFDPRRIYIGGHSAGGHLALEFVLRWSDFAQSCSLPTGCPAAAGAIGFEGIYDISAWDAYDDDFWGGQFFCATRKAFGHPAGPLGCTDSSYSLPCWSVGSPTFLAQNAETLGLVPTGDTLIIHSPGDNWVDIDEAINFGAAMSLAFPATNSIVNVDGSCATGQHNDPLNQLKLASCIANFVASGGAGI